MDISRLWVIVWPTLIYFLASVTWSLRIVWFSQWSYNLHIIVSCSIGNLSFIKPLHDFPKWFLFSFACKLHKQTSECNHLRFVFLLLFCSLFLDIVEANMSLLQTGPQLLCCLARSLESFVILIQFLHFTIKAIKHIKLLFLKYVSCELCQMTNKKFLNL